MVQPYFCTTANVITYKWGKSFGTSSFQTRCPKQHDTGSLLLWKWLWTRPKIRILETSNLNCFVCCIIVLCKASVFLVDSVKCTFSHSPQNAKSPHKSLLHDCGQNIKKLSLELNCTRIKQRTSSLSWKKGQQNNFLRGHLCCYFFHQWNILWTHLAMFEPYYRIQKIRSVLGCISTNCYWTKMTSGVRFPSWCKHFSKKLFSKY